MQKRESGIDLLRCFALLCVNGVHGFLYNGFYFEDQVGALMWSADAARWLFYCCNCLFMMITGYLRSGKPMQKGYYRSLLPILVGYVLTCLISFPIRHFIQGEKLSLMEWVTKLVTFGNYGWYVEMYIGLFLLSPIINIVLERMKNLQQYCWLLARCCSSPPCRPLPASTLFPITGPACILSPCTSWAPASAGSGPISPPGFPPCWPWPPWAYWV